MGFNEKVHAFIVARYYVRLTEAFAQRGEAAFIHAVQYYAGQRGRRMAQRAIRDGQPLTHATFLQYGELRMTDEVGPTQREVTSIAPRERAAHAVAIDHGQAKARRRRDGQHGIDAARLHRHGRIHLASEIALHHFKDAPVFRAADALFAKDCGRAHHGDGHDQRVVGHFPAEINVRALRACAARGIYLALNSGRSFETLREFACALDVNPFVISVNGARIDEGPRTFPPRRCTSSFPLSGRPSTSRLSTTLRGNRCARTAIWCATCSTGGVCWDFRRFELRPPQGGDALHKN